MVALHQRITMLKIADACKTKAKGYTFSVAETEAYGIGVPNVPWRTTATARFFYVRTLCPSFYGRALVRERLRSPVPTDAGTPTLSCAWPPRLASAAGSIKPVRGGRYAC